MIKRRLLGKIDYFKNLLSWLKKFLDVVSHYSKVESYVLTTFYNI